VGHSSDDLKSGHSLENGIKKPRKRTIKGSNSNFISPLRDEEGVIQLDPQKIKDLWEEHYRGLATDPTGNSQRSGRWRALGMEMVTKLSGLNGRITLEELYSTIKVMKSGKAPGEDGLPTERYKACLPDPTPRGGGGSHEAHGRGDTRFDVRHMEAKANPSGMAERSHMLHPKERRPDRER